MNHSSLLKATLAAAALATASVLGTAQIERLNLDQMVAKTDDSVIGTITKREVIRIDHEVDGAELYYTHLTVNGKSLVSGEAKTVVVTFPGGFINDEEGVWNSEAPSADDVKVGNRIVVFHAFSENMGGDLAANALYASHGGLYRTVEGRNGPIVMGRGEGYAIQHNIKLSGLDAQITAIDKAQRETEQSNK